MSDGAYIIVAVAAAYVHKNIKITSRQFTESNNLLFMRLVYTLVSSKIIVVVAVSPLANFIIRKHSMLPMLVECLNF